MQGPVVIELSIVGGEIHEYKPKGLFSHHSRLSLWVHGTWLDKSGDDTL